MHRRLSQLVRLAVAAGFALSAASPAFAQDYARTGLYLGIGGLGAYYPEAEDELEDELRSGGLDVDLTGGFELLGGYRLHSHVAVEGEFELLAKTDVDAGNNNQSELESWSLTGNIKAFALTGRIQPYAKVGVGVMEAKLKNSTLELPGFERSDFAARFGAGVDFYLNPGIVAYTGLDYVLPAGSVEDLDYLSFGAGIQLRF